MMSEAVKHKYIKHWLGKKYSLLNQKSNYFKISDGEILGLFVHDLEASDIKIK